MRSNLPALKTHQLSTSNIETNKKKQKKKRRNEEKYEIPGENLETSC